MPAKVTDRASGYREIDRWEGGVGWIAHPDETMERASHALATDAGVFIVDPVDAAGVDNLVNEFGDVVGVVVLSNHHTRDAEPVASQHGVPIYLPKQMTDVGPDLDVPVERFSDRLPGSEYELVTVSVGSGWQEFALWDGETLVVGESLGTADYIRVGDERVGVMTLRRLTPPRDSLSQFSPERLLVGHGAGVFEDATPALCNALVYSRRRFPGALLENGLQQLKTVTAALRT